MRLRDCLIAAMLMSLTLITSLAKPLPLGRTVRSECEDSSLKPSAPPRMMVPPPPELIAADEVLESVYYNTLAILSTSNTCSDFFGGSRASMEVFSRLMGQVRKEVMSPSIAMRMHGETTNAEDLLTNTRYRLFSKVSINSNGPFYRKSNFRSEQTIFGVGSFAPNTREVRVLILLHELGHLMKGPDGKWLLPDDGRKEEVSLNNSRKIEKVCGEQISSLGNGEALRNLALLSQPDEKLALDSNHADQSPLGRTGNH